LPVLNDCTIFEIDRSGACLQDLQVIVESIPVFVDCVNLGVCLLQMIFLSFIYLDGEKNAVSAKRIKMKELSKPCTSTKGATLEAPGDLAIL